MSLSKYEATRNDWEMSMQRRVRILEQRIEYLDNLVFKLQSTVAILDRDFKGKDGVYYTHEEKTEDSEAIEYVFSVCDNKIIIKTYRFRNDEGKLVVR